MNERQTARLRRLSEWLHEHHRKFLFELLVPAEPAQLESVGGSDDRYDTELRPQLMMEAILQLQNGGVEPDIWKIEGIDDREACNEIAQLVRREGRDRVSCVVLGRGASDDEGRRVAARGRGPRRLHRLRDRPLDLRRGRQVLRRRSRRLRPRRGGRRRSRRSTAASSTSTRARRHPRRNPSPAREASAARAPLAGVPHLRGCHRTSLTVSESLRLVSEGVGTARCRQPGILAALECAARGCSSVGRASASQAEGRGFESHRPLRLNARETALSGRLLFSAGRRSHSLMWIAQHGANSSES